MNIRHLRAFVAVCESGSVSIAAERMQLSQPAVTQSMAKLERLLDVSLFNRRSKGLVPTPAGTVFLVRVEGALNRLAVALRNIRAAAGVMGALTTTHLKALDAVARHGSFSLAAVALGISQPALHRAARDLETQLGKTLYTKTHRGIDVTRDGDVLVRAIRLAFADLDHGVEDIVALTSGKSTILRVGALSLAQGTIMPPVLNRLHDIAPEVHVRVVDAPFDDMLYALRHGEIDIMVGRLRDPLPAPDIRQNALFEDRLGVFCRPEHPVLSIGHPTKADLAAYPWVVGHPGMRGRQHFDQFFADVPQDCLGPMIESSAHALVSGLLRGSDKLAMLSQIEAAEDCRRGTLARVDTDLGDSAHVIGTTVRDDWKPTPMQETFLDTLSTQVDLLH
ncbi:LysR family transcriptional regulator [Tropicibacter naphthalenivorans]|nr:LysR family transcriptional regulator [Tropicibacter naphthalenivorans]